MNGTSYSTSLASIQARIQARIQTGLRNAAVAGIVLALTGLTAPIAHAADINIGALPACAPANPTVSTAQVLRFLRGNGYVPSPRVTWHRKIFPNPRLTPAQRCGIIRALGVKSGTRYAIYFNGKGQRFGRRSLGPAPGGGGGGAAGTILTPAQIRGRLTGPGFTRITNVRRGGTAANPIYTAEASRGTRRFKLRLNGKTGAITGATPMAATLLTPAQIRSVLARRGLTKIRNVRRGGTAANPIYTAEGDRGARSFRVTVNGKTGRILKADPIASVPKLVTEAQFRAAVRRRGYTNLTKFRKSTHRGRPIHIIEANKGGQRFRVTARADGAGGFIGINRLGPVKAKELTEAQVRVRIRAQGWTNIQKLKRFGPPGGHVYIGEASKGGKRFKIRANAKNGSVD